MPQVRKTKELIDKIKADFDRGKLTHEKIAARHGVSMGYVARVKKGLAKPVESAETIEVAKADPTNEEILRLGSQLVAVNDEKRRLKKALTAAQRENSIFEAVVDEMHSVVTPIKPLPKASALKKHDKPIRESCVLHLSDEHADSVILPHQVGNFERYDFNIALRRAEQLVDTAIRYTQRTQDNHRFDDLYIFANGDHVSGEIHGAVDHSHYRNMFRNALAVGQMHALMFRDFARHFPRVHVLYTPGNHGRRTNKKDYHGAWNNWDYLVGETAKAHCRGLENVDFMIPDSFSAVVEIEGHGFCVSHGDDIRSWSGIPWYGIERKTRRWSALHAASDRKIEYYCFGHFHNPATQATVTGETIINGTWVSTDPYSFNSLTSITTPKQWLHGVHRKYGATWRLPIQLKTEREHLGANRYSVLLARE